MMVSKAQRRNKLPVLTEDVLPTAAASSSASKATTNSKPPEAAAKPKEEITYYQHATISFEDAVSMDPEPTLESLLKPPTTFLFSSTPGTTNLDVVGNNNAFVTKLSLIASLSGLLFGYDTGVVSGAVIFLRSDLDLGNLQIEILVASTILSAAIAAWYGDHLLDDWGRKRTLMVASLIFVVGSVIMGLAGGPGRGYYMLLAGRIIVGVAIGFASEAGPLYISECAPPDLRGSLTTLFNVAVVGGQVFASVLCGCLSYLPETYNWRIMLLFGAVPALGQMIGFYTLPRSPTWLVTQGRRDEAEQVLYQIRGREPPGESKIDTSDLEVIHEKVEEDHGGTHLYDPVQEELEEIVEEHEAAQKGAGATLWQMWCHPIMRRSMLLGCCLWAASQLAGINTIMYYGASIVERAGLEGDLSFAIWVTVPLNMMQLLGILVCYKIIDKPGRRFTLLTSMTGVWMGLFGIGLGFYFDAGIFTVLAMCFYLFAFGVGLSTMPYTLNAEIYPMEFRGKCVAQSTAMFWFTNFWVSLTFLTMAKYMGNAGVFFFYTVIVIVTEIWFYVNMPETAGKSLHEVQVLFAEQANEDVASLASLHSSVSSQHESKYGSLNNNDGDDSSLAESDMTDTSDLNALGA